MDKPGKETSENPVKDGVYDNIADTIRYAAENFYRIADRDDEFMDQLSRVQGSTTLAEGDPMAWMGAW